MKASPWRLYALAAIGFALTAALFHCAALEPAARTVHMSADACVQLARIYGDAELELACHATSDLTELIGRKRLAQSRDAGVP